MPHNVKRRFSPCAPDGETMNEDLFRVYLLIVAIMLLLGLLLPSPVQVDRAKLDRLSRQAPAPFVANVFVCVGVDGRVTDTYCLKTRTDV